MPPTNPALAAANAIIADARLTVLLEKLVATPSLQKRALANGPRVLQQHGIELHPEITAVFGAPPKRTPGKPGPGWEPFSIILTRCHTYYILDPKPPGRYQKQEICFGIEIRNNPPPGGPRG
jgi:hypothetical protein